MKAISRTVLIFLFTISSVQAAPETDDLKIYVEKLIDEGYKTFNDKTLSETERTSKAKELLSSHLYLDWMAHHALGRHRRVISQEKLNEFSKVYSRFVIKAYADLSASYSGEKAVLKNIKQIEDDMFIVNTEILRPNGQPPIKVDYLVLKIENNEKDPYLVGDIITEGISILNSQQAEFNSVISNHGIESLINELRSRTMGYSKRGAGNHAEPL